MKVLLLLIVLPSISSAMEDQDILFNNLKTQVEQCKSCLEAVERKNITVESYSILRDKLQKTIRAEIATVEQCLSLDIIYKKVTQKKDEYAILYELHKTNIQNNYDQALTIYNAGYKDIAITWLHETMNEIEETFKYFSEKKQCESSLIEAKDIYTLTQQVLPHECD